MEGWSMGWRMHGQNYPREENPFTLDEPMSRQAWFRGWDEAQDEYGSNPH